MQPRWWRKKTYTLECSLKDGSSSKIYYGNFAGGALTKDDFKIVEKCSDGSSKELASTDFKMYDSNIEITSPYTFSYSGNRFEKKVFTFKGTNATGSYRTPIIDRKYKFEKDDGLSNYYNLYITESRSTDFKLTNKMNDSTLPGATLWYEMYGKPVGVTVDETSGEVTIAYNNFNAKATVIAGMSYKGEDVVLDSYSLFPFKGEHMENVGYEFNIGNSTVKCNIDVEYRPTDFKPEKGWLNIPDIINGNFVENIDGGGFNNCALITDLNLPCCLKQI